MGLLSKIGKKKSGPRELADNELPSAIDRTQPSTPKQKRSWRGRAISAENGEADDPAVADPQSSLKQKKRGLFGRKKDSPDAATPERTSSIEDGGTKGRKGKAKKEKPAPPPPPRILSEAEAAEAAESQRRAIDSIRNVHYNPENAIYNWEPVPVDTGVSAAPNVSDGAGSPPNTRAGKLKAMLKPGKKATSSLTHSTAGPSSSAQSPADEPDVITNTATPDKTGKFGGMFRRTKSKDKDRDAADDDLEANPSTDSTPAKSKGVFGRFSKGSKPPEASPSRAVYAEGVQMSSQHTPNGQQQYDAAEASYPQLNDMQQDFTTREYAPVHAAPIHSIGRDQLHTSRYDPAGLGANYTGEEPAAYHR